MIHHISFDLDRHFQFNGAYQLIICDHFHIHFIGDLGLSKNNLLIPNIDSNIDKLFLSDVTCQLNQNGSLRNDC